MKKILAFALSATMLLGLTACGGDDKEKEPVSTMGALEESYLPEESTAVETATAAPTPTAAQKPSYRIQSTLGFHGGYAVVRFYDEANRISCAGMIGTDGKLQYYVADNSVDESRSGNGYLCFSKGDTYHIVTPKGKVITHQLGENLSLMQAGDGYAVIQEYKSGFDAVEYVYHIYNDAGKEIASYSSGTQRLYSDRLYYAGEGTFLFLTNKRDDTLGTYGYDAFYGDIYLAESDTWLRDQVVSNTGSPFRNYTYQDGVLMFRGASHNGSSNTHPGEFAYIDSKGNVKSFTVPEEVGSRPFYLGHSDGIMTFLGSSNNKRTVHCYDVAADTWYSYQGQYADRMAGQEPVVGDGYVALALQGADNKTYTMLLNGKTEEVWDAPLLGIPHAIRDGKVLVMDGNTMTSYDLKGKELGKVERYDTYANQGADTIVVGGQNEYFTLDGKKAFEVNFTSGKEVKLPTQ